MQYRQFEADGGTEAPRHVDRRSLLRMLGGVLIATLSTILGMCVGKRTEQAMLDERFRNRRERSE